MKPRHPQGDRLRAGRPLPVAGRVAARISAPAARRVASVVLLLTVIAMLTAHPSAAREEGFEPDRSILSLYATRTPYLYYHNVGLLGLTVMNLGVVGSMSSDEYFGASWEGGEYLWAAALWVGAVGEDGLGYVSTGYAWTDEGEFEFRPSLDPVDRIYASFEGATGGDRAGFTESGGDDDGDGLIDEDFLNGKDDDGDRLIDEDYAAIAQQMFSCEFWDYASEAIRQYPKHEPLYLKVKQRSFAWSTQGENEFIGIDYAITNEGFENLRDVYIGFFVDADIGRKDAYAYHIDDLGSRTSIDTVVLNPRSLYTCVGEFGAFGDCARRDLHTEVTYMYDAPGSMPQGSSADDLGNGANGYFGTALLGHTTDISAWYAPVATKLHTSRFFSGVGTYPSGDPQNDFERYDLLSGGSRSSVPLDTPADYRYCISTGPFRELRPGQELRFQIALVVGDRLPGLQRSAVAAQRVFDGAWADVDGLAATGCEGRELCLHVDDPTESLWWVDPCNPSFPPPPPIKVKNTACDHPSYWVDNDCDCCTPLQVDRYHCEGWETLVHWVTTVAPPPPQTSLEDPDARAAAEGDQRVRIEWDNTSELLLDPADAPFCGYRVWRVEGWQRPIGSFGPAPHQWEPVADLAVTAGAYQLPLSQHTNEFAAIVDTIVVPESGEELFKYAVGRYFFVDSLGVKNGMVYFYDVTAYSCWYDELGRYHELDSQPAATEAEGVHPRWGAVSAGDWRDAVIVVPDPWKGGAAWDLVPSDADPTGTHIDFANLPDRTCEVRIYTLAGDLVRTLQHDPGALRSGTVRWNMITRNGQEISSGVYLYAITCGGEVKVGRFTVVR